MLSKHEFFKRNLSDPAVNKELYSNILEKNKQNGYHNSIEIKLFEESTAEWVSFGEFNIHRLFFLRGIVVIKSIFDELEDGVVSENSITLNSRNLHYYSISDKYNNSSYINKTRNLLDKLQIYINFPKYYNLNYLGMLVNPKRREEIFLPFIITNKTDFYKIYVYPWMVNSVKDFKFSGFKHFVTAGCMFGSSLKGKDKHGGFFNLIKHNIKFFADQQITNIHYEPSGCYEEILFNEIERWAFLIKNLSKQNDITHNEPKIIYHLPYIDYILFGIGLFLQGRITLNALDRLFIIILQGEQKYRKKITQIFNHYQLSVLIQSPFENMFNKEQLVGEKGISKKILEVLQISITQSIQASEMEFCEKEELFIKRCLELLTTNKNNEKQQAVWQDFKIIGEKEKVSTLEQLFKLANALIIASTAKNNKPYEVCALQMLSEKQIQINYTEYSKQLANYPPVFNLTVLDPVLTYESDNMLGLPFYFEYCHESLGKLISQEKILDLAHQINFDKTQENSLKIM